MCHNPYVDCYPSNVLRTMPGTCTRGTLFKALREFEEQGWITRGERTGQTKPITLTAEGEHVFSQLIDLINVLTNREQQTSS